MTEEELYQRIVSKHPQYAKIPSKELMPKIYAKYPQYQKAISLSPKEKEKTSEFGIGGVGYGARAVQEGLGVKDIPHIAAKAVSGASYGLPEAVSKKPLISSIAGPVGAFGGKSESFQLPFPKAASKGGEMIGGAAELVSGGVMEPSQLLIGKIPTPVKSIPKSERLARTMIANIEEGIKVPGATQGGYINAQASSPVDLTDLQRVFDDLPQKVKFAIAKDPSVTRIGDMVEPNLKNSEIIRSHILDHINTLDFQSQAPLQESYRQIGEIMTKNRPELSEAMGAYAKAKRAGEQLIPRFKNSKGFIRTQNLGKIFGDGNENIQAVNQLAEYNPEITRAMNQIQRYNTAQKVKKIAGTVAGIGTAEELIRKALSRR